MARKLSSEHQWRTLVCCHCGHEIHVLVDCKNRFCPDCSPRRAARIANRLTTLISKIQKKPGFGLKMITLSTANCTDVQAGITHLVASFRKMRNRRLWKMYVNGGAFVIEVTGRPGNWHPHIHAIVYARYIPWRTLWKSWKRCSGGNAVFISTCNPANATRYITKYLTKSQIPPHLLLQLSMELRKFRLFQRFGQWHNIVLTPRIWHYRCDSCGHSDWLADRDFKKEDGVRIRAVTDWLFVGL